MEIKKAKKLLKGASNCMWGVTKCTITACKGAIGYAAYTVAGSVDYHIGLGAKQAKKELIEECKKEMLDGFEDCRMGVDRIKNIEDYSAKSEFEILIKQHGKGCISDEKFNSEISSLFWGERK